MASSHRDEISRLELLHAAHPDGLVFPHLADAYRRAGRFAQAESVLRAGLRRHAEHSSAHVVLGRLRLDQGQRDEARAAFHRVLQLDSQNQVALEQLGELAIEEGRLADALEHFRRLQSVKPDVELGSRVAELEGALSLAAAGGPPRPPQAVAAEGRGFGGAGGNGGHGPAAGPRHRPPDAAHPPHPPRTPRTPHSPHPPHSPEPGEVVTETMAELYARQGLRERAAGVYQQLLDRNPGDARLRGKLESVRGSPAPERPEPGRSSGPSAPPVAAPTAGIGGYLRGVLEWHPAPGSAVADGGDPRTAPVANPGEPWVASVAEADDPWTAPVADASDPWAGGSVARERPRQASPSAAAGAPVAGSAVPAPAPAPVSAGAESPQTRAFIAITDLLVGLLEFRDPFFRGSSSLTRLLATSVANELGLGAEDKVNLALAAVLRDLGRLALGGRLLPTSRLSETPESRQRIERHVDLALHLLEGVELPTDVRAAVRHHHERWDGAGYPDGLAGERIPRLARILAVVDSFAAMVSPRPYRLPRKVPEAARELREAAGTQYDPAVVEALERVLDRRDRAHLGFVQRHYVLMVDPDQPGAVVTAAKLCSAGYLAEVAADVRTARERMRRVPVAALVVSAGASHSDAEAFIREVRSDPLFAALPLVVIEAESVALRVRLLECGADVCFPPGVSHAELQGTLGALVRRTFHSRTDGVDGAGAGESPWLALQGDVQDFPLTWLLQVMKYDSRTAAIGIRAGDQDGAIYLEQGDAVHAEIRGSSKGEEALREMLRWARGRFTVQPDARPREQTIRSSIMHLLLTQAVDEDHAAAGIFGAVSPDG